MVNAHIPHREAQTRTILTIAPWGWYGQRVGRFLTRGYKIWDWRINEASRWLYHVKGQTMDIYTPLAIPLYANRPNCWTRSQLDVPQEEYGTICSVRNVGLAAYSVTSFSEAPPTPLVPTDFWSIIERWGNTWMRKNLTIRGDVSWLV